MKISFNAKINSIFAIGGIFLALSMVYSKGRRELTVYGGVMCDMAALCSYDEYVEFMNSLTDDEFVVNYFTLLMNEPGYNIWTKLIDDSVPFEDVIKTMHNEDFMNEYRKKIEA